MKLSIATKLFFAVLATAILVALAIGVTTRISFTRGFLGYLNERGTEFVESLAPTVAAAYQQHGSWDFLRRNEQAWFELIHSKIQASLMTEGPPPAPVALLDEARNIVIGPPRLEAVTVMRPIVVEGRTVGWLALIPFEQITAAASVRFQERQLHAIWIIGLLSVLLAGVVALWLARLVLAPVKRVAAATHRLAAGDYATRVDIASRDEVGRLAEDFNHLALALEKNEQMRRTFMADVSHELRTPLAILRGEIEAMEDGIRPLSIETVKSLQTEATLLQKLVDDLYDLSLSDLGALTYRKVYVDVAHVLQMTADAFRPRFAERDLTLDIQIPEQTLMILADENRLHQMFNNLMENMVRYTEAGGRVQIGCRRQDSDVVIDFQDSKPGVASDHLPRLFERFFRSDSARSRANGGAGLGLAICRNIAEAHGGRIVAQPSPLGGLWITVTFPLTPA